MSNLIRQSHEMHIDRLEEEKHESWEQNKKLHEKIFFLQQRNKELEAKLRRQKDLDKIEELEGEKRGILEANDNLISRDLLRDQISLKKSQEIESQIRADIRRISSKKSQEIESLNKQVAALRDQLYKDKCAFETLSCDIIVKGIVDLLSDTAAAAANYVHKKDISKELEWDEALKAVEDEPMFDGQTDRYCPQCDYVDRVPIGGWHGTCPSCGKPLRRGRKGATER
jgi:hypothetical protein